MLYHPISRSDYLSSVKIKSNFLPDGSDPSFGTGFFIRRNTDLYLVTVRHVIGENHKPPANRSGKTLSSVDLEYHGINRVTGIFQHHQIANFVAEFRECENGNDLAIAKITSDLGVPFEDINSFQYDDLANNSQSNNYSPGEPVFLSGYPPISAFIVQGQQASMPVVRQGIFSTPPTIGLRIPGKLGSDYCYIDSFALGGMSGSPILVPQIGLPPPDSSPITFSRNEPKRVVGVLVGKANSREKYNTSVHSGLSYYVRSQSILNLLNSF